MPCQQFCICGQREKTILGISLGAIPQVTTGENWKQGWQLHQIHLLIIHLQFYHILSNSLGPCLFFLIGHMTDGILTYDHVDDVKGEDVNGEQGEGHGEQVEVSVVPLAHTVADPGTVVIKPICEERLSYEYIISPLPFLFLQFVGESDGGEQHQKTDTNILLYFTSLQQTKSFTAVYSQRGGTNTQCESQKKEIISIFRVKKPLTAATPIFIQPHHQHGSREQKNVSGFNRA